MARAFLIGPHVRLRAMEETDAEIFAEWINSPELRAFLLVRYPMSLRDEREWIAGQSVMKGTPSNFVFAIELVKGERVIGAIGLHAIDWIHRRAMTGMYLYPEEMRGKGYGSEAKGLLLDYAFGELGLHSVYAFAFGGNLRSQRALERQGYRRSGVFRKAYLVRGEWADGIYYDILREEWEERRKGERGRGARKAEGRADPARRKSMRGGGAVRKEARIESRGVRRKPR
jgi:RimJ/RimL family protein N-acetyltransferase